MILPTINVVEANQTTTPMIIVDTIIRRNGCCFWHPLTLFSAFQCRKSVCMTLSVKNKRLSNITSTECCKKVIPKVIADATCMKASVSYHQPPFLKQITHGIYNFENCTYNGRWTNRKPWLTTYNDVFYPSKFFLILEPK